MKMLIAEGSTNGVATELREAFEHIRPVLEEHAD